MATYTQIMASSEVDVTRPILAEVAAQIADVQVRNRGTIGGNICSNDPTNHLPPLLVALGASMTIRGADGERTVPADEFFLGVYLTAVGDGRAALEGDGSRGREAGRRVRVDHDRPRRHVHRQCGRDSRRRRRASRSAASTPCRSCVTPAARGRGERPRGASAGAALDPPSTSTPPPTTAAISPRCARSARSCRQRRGGGERGSARQEPRDHGRGQRRRLRARGRRAPAARPLHPRRRRPDRHAHRLRHRQLRRLHDPPRRAGGEELHAARGPGGRRDDRDRRGPGRGRAS